jgi:hypothetical protein
VKQSLVANGSETTFVSKRQLGKHVPATTGKHTTIEILLETAFSTRSVQRDYKEDSGGNRVISVRESVRKRGSWKGAADQRGLKRGSRRVVDFRNRYQETTSEDTAGWKRLVKCENQLWRCN